jgi:protein subunit release factor B
LAPVFTSAVSSHQAAGGQPVNKFDGAVVLNLQPFSQGSDRRVHSWRQSLQRQHQLVLLRFQAHFPGCLFAEVKEQANLIAQLRQCLIIGKGQRLFHSAMLN